jgi:hypothetical protein
VVIAGIQERAGTVFPLQTNRTRMRVRAQGLHYFFEGETTLRVEWREPGANWVRCPIFWPLIIERDVGPAPGAAPAVQIPH